VHGAHALPMSQDKGGQFTMSSYLLDTTLAMCWSTDSATDTVNLDAN
jgi:hypothetical protein